MRVMRGAALCAFLLISGQLVLAQQPGPKTDPCPLARPTPLVVLKAGDVGLAVAAISKVVVDDHFAVTQRNDDEGYLEATRGTADSFDKVVIWIERDLNRPADRLKVFFLYGRYEKIWAGELAVKRVVSDGAVETRDLRSRLSNLTVKEPQ